MPKTVSTSMASSESTRLWAPVTSVGTFAFACSASREGLGAGVGAGPAVGLGAGLGAGFASLTSLPLSVLAGFSLGAHAGWLTLNLLTLNLLTKKPSSPRVRTTEGSALARGACALMKYENSCHTRTLPPSTGGVNVRDSRSHDPDLSSQSQNRPARTCCDPLVTPPRFRRVRDHQVATSAGRARRGVSRRRLRHSRCRRACGTWPGRHGGTSTAVVRSPRPGGPARP